MNNSIAKLARLEVLQLKPYSSARSEKPNGRIYLNANENNFLLNSNKNLNRYPEPQPKKLIEKLSALYEVKPQQIVATRGSDEAIELLLRVFCRPSRDKVVVTPPTYGMYGISAAIQGAEIINVPLLKNTGFALDSDNIMKLRRSAIKLIFLCSPNNPTGNLLAKSKILQICCEFNDKALVIVDEAYIEFAQTKSIVEYIERYPNLVVLRTLSKLYGLAAARCGIAIANAEVINLLKKIIAPYPVPTPVVEAVCDHLTDVNIAEIKNNLASLVTEREKMYAFLQRLPFVHKVWPSKANFLLLAVDDAQTTIERCASKGIIIRDRSSEYGLANCLRISIGTPEENRLLKEVLI